MPSQTPSAARPIIASSRSRISRAALLVKVTASSSPGKARPVARMCASRVVSTRVLPVPAPASTSTAPSTASTARRCASLRRGEQRLGWSDAEAGGGDIGHAAHDIATRRTETLAGAISIGARLSGGRGRGKPRCGAKLLQNRRALARRRSAAYDAEHSPIVPDARRDRPLILILTYIGMAAGRIAWLRVDRTGIALLAVIALLASGEMTLDDFGSAVDLPTLAFLFAMMIISAQFAESGFIDLCARTITESRRRHGGAAGADGRDRRRRCRRCWPTTS